MQMPIKGKLPEWEREDNRAKIFFTLIQNPLTFTEILNETRLSRSTLTQHLKDLQKQQVVEKAIMHGKVVYRPTLDEEGMLNEIKRASFDGLLSLISAINRNLAMSIEVLLRVLVKYTVYFKTKELRDGKKPSAEEIRAFWSELNTSQIMPKKLEKNLEQYKLKPFLEAMNELSKLSKEE